MGNGILVRAIEVVGILFAAFGGFLVGVAPPQDADARFAVGISSFFALIVLLFVSSLSGKKYRKVWLTVAVVSFALTVAAAYYYKSNYDSLTFSFPHTEGKHIAGTYLTPKAQEERDKNPSISNMELVAGFGGLPFATRVWPNDAINAAKNKLVFSYVFLVTALALSIFALTEGTLGAATIGAPQSNQAPRKRKERVTKTAADNPADAKQSQPKPSPVATNPEVGAPDANNVIEKGNVLEDPAK
jgi:hypothetical protein